MGTVLLLLVLRPGPPPEVMTAARAALRQILADRVSIRVEEGLASLPAAALARRQADEHVALAASLEVLDANVLRVSVRGAADPLPLRHTLTFEAQDAAPERGRALGYAIASMLPPAWLERPTEEAPGRPPRLSLLLAPELGVGLGARTALFGGRVALAWLASPRWAVETLAAYRAGTLEGAGATFSHAFLGAGVVFRSVAPARSGLGGAVHLDVGFVRHAVTHLDEDDKSPVHRSSLLPGARLGAQGDWWFSPGTAVFAGLDLEAEAGTVDVYVKDTQQANLGGLAALAAWGLLIRH